jgi:DNA-binding CsgD family transcriptional regulator
VTVDPNIRLTARSFASISRIAGIAASGGPADVRTEEVLDELQGVFPFDAGILSAADPVTPGQRRSIVARGYPERFTEYLLSPEWHAECVAPFGVARTGWPVRERDLPIDPMSLRGIAEYGRPAGLYEGMLSALITPQGQHTGFLMLSWSSVEPPPDEACAVVGCVSLALASMIDPLQSARAVTAALDDDSIALALQPDGTITRLRGTPPEGTFEPNSPARLIVERALAGGRTTASFLWPRTAGGWYQCRAFRCRDALIVMTFRRLDGVHGLTRRELEVLRSLAAGHSNSDIAGELSVTTRTVRAHVEHIFEKLEVTTRSAAVARAVGEGLLVPRQAGTVPS